MEINTTIVADWLNKMNKRVVVELNNNNIATSKNWIGFSSTYDAVNNQIEATYDNGKNSAIRVCYFGFKCIDSNIILARAAVEDITHKSAKMNITNMRRHDFSDCKALAERDHITEKKLYWYFREHAKECLTCDQQPKYYGATNKQWAEILCEGLKRAFDVGEKKQIKSGISDAEEVAQADFRKRLNDARSTLELLDPMQCQLHAVGDTTDSVFKRATVDYTSGITCSYTNPYDKSVFTKINCAIKFELDSSKCVFDADSDVYNSDLAIRYDLFYNEQSDVAYVENIMYDFGYYFTVVTLKIDSSFSLKIDLTAGLVQSTIFGSRAVTLDEFKTRVLDKVTERVNTCRVVKEQFIKTFCNKQNEKITA